MIGLLCLSIFVYVLCMIIPRFWPLALAPVTLGMFWSHAGFHDKQSTCLSSRQPLNLLVANDGTCIVMDVGSACPARRQVCKANGLLREAAFCTVLYRIDRRESIAFEGRGVRSTSGNRVADDSRSLLSFAAVNSAVRGLDITRFVSVEDYLLGR